MRTLSGVVVGACLFSVSACATRELAPPPPPAVTSESKAEPGRVEESKTITVTAVVTDVDLKERLVTLKGSDGEERTIHVGPEVRNLPQVKRGDEVVVSYLESVVFQLRKKGQAEPGVAVAEDAARAPVGGQPGAVGARVTTVTATVMKIDKTAPSITLKAPDGKLVTLPVRDVSRLDPVKIGDLIEITYTEAMAISVEKPQK